MRIGKIFKILLFAVVLVSFSLFIKDVHNVTQDRIASLKRDLVLAVEQRDAVRLDIETLQAANSDLLSKRKALEEADLNRKEEMNTLVKLKEEQIAKIASLQHDLATNKANLDRIQVELDKTKAEKIELSNLREQLKLKIDQNKVVANKAIEDKDIELASLKKIIQSKDNELQRVISSLDHQKKKAEAEQVSQVQHASITGGIGIPDSAKSDRLNSY